MSTAQEILNHALQLSSSERAEIAEGILRSLSDTNSDESAANDAAWFAEADRRVSEYRAGRMEGSEWRDSIARVRTKLADRK